MKEFSDKNRDKEKPQNHKKDKSVCEKLPSVASSPFKQLLKNACAYSGCGFTRLLPSIELAIIDREDLSSSDTAR